MFLSIVACSEKPIKEYSSPEKPILLSPLKNNTSKEGAPVSNWTAIRISSGGPIKHFVKIFDTLSSQNSGWITETSWTPTSNALGIYNWRVKSIDVSTGKESGWSETWQFALIAKSESTELHLDIRTAKFGPYDSINTFID